MCLPGKGKQPVPARLRASANRANNPLQLTGSNKFNPRASINSLPTSNIRDIKFNHANTVCMLLSSKGNCTLNSPIISLNLQKKLFVPKFKYLGSFITQDNSDDENMRRQIGNCYARSNGIIKNLYDCSPVVKCDLFQAFCCNMDCSHLWCDF